MIAENVKSVRQRIARCCEKVGRRPEEVELVCVTKGSSLKEIDELLGIGEKVIGENRVKDALSKYSVLGDKAIWHMVGHLQTNKVKDAVKIFSLIHSIDSVRLAKEIDKEAKSINKIQDILIQVNTSGEKSKFGIAPNELEELFKNITLYPNISIKGLMTIAPEVNDPEEARSCFRNLRELRDKINEIRNTKYGIRILSMGMSNDFDVAIEEGSNIVRIGRAIFGSFL